MLKHSSKNQPSGTDVVFLIDVDNTLLDNDHIIADLGAYLHRKFGADSAARYWQIFESLRAELGYADYLGALQRYRLTDLHDPALLQMSSFLVDYPFAALLYPGALEVIGHLHRFGSCVILSDGDAVFQPRKVQRSGLWDAVQGRVLIYVHKEQMLATVRECYPANHYVMIDDKLRILAAMKSAWRDRLTTLFVRQGHYAADLAANAQFAAADLTVERIGDVRSWPAIPGGGASVAANT